MAFELGDASQDHQALHEINLIPLIDVMLVLMIIFLVTATVLNPSVPLDLPDTSASVNALPAKVIQVSISKNGALYWDNQPITQSQLNDRLKASAASQPQLQLRADKQVAYDKVAQVLAASSNAGITNIAFISD